MTEEEKAAADAEAKRLADEKKKKTKFEPEQQEYLDKLINAAFKEGASKVEEAFKAQLAEEKKQREALQAKLDELAKTIPAKEEKKEATNPELDAVKAEFGEVKGILTQIKTERDELKKRVEQADRERRKAKKKDLFLQAMKDAEVTFFDPLEAYDLAERAGYEWDEETDQPTILNKDTKRPKLNDEGDPMTVVQFVADFAEKKKYLVKAPTQDSGTGASTERKTEIKDKNKKELIADKPVEELSDAEFEALVQKTLQKQR